MSEIPQSDTQDIEVTIHICDNEVSAGPDHTFERYAGEQVADEEDQLLGVPLNKEQYVIKISESNADGRTEEFTLRGPAHIKQQVVDSVMKLLNKGCGAREIVDRAEEPIWQDEYEASIDL